MIYRDLPRAVGRSLQKVNYYATFDGDEYWAVLFPKHEVGRILIVLNMIEKPVTHDPEQGKTVTISYYLPLY